MRLCIAGHRIAAGATSYQVSEVRRSDVPGHGHACGWLCSEHWQAFTEALAKVTGPPDPYRVHQNKQRQLSLLARKDHGP